MNQTAVRWYAEQAMKLEIEKAKGNISMTQMLIQLSDILEQALEIEKEQMRNASCPYVGGWEIDEFDEFEIWYNEKYKNTKQ
jgi:hypothetical protein